MKSVAEETEQVVENGGPTAPNGVQPALKVPSKPIHDLVRLYTNI